MKEKLQKLRFLRPSGLGRFSVLCSATNKARKQATNCTCCSSYFADLREQSLAGNPENPCKISSSPSSKGTLTPLTVVGFITTIIISNVMEKEVFCDAATAYRLLQAENEALFVQQSVCLPLNIIASRLVPTLNTALERSLILVESSEADKELLD